MSGIFIPLFPLKLLPLPGELVPLHIFEPRYRQLLQDMEMSDISFGIFPEIEGNLQRIGAMMKLESVVRRYPGGESDIVVRCIDIFTLSAQHRTFKGKLYPGGDITRWDVDQKAMPGVEVYKLFLQFQEKRRMVHQYVSFGLFQIAAELNLDLPGRYRFLSLAPESREAYLLNRLRLELHVMSQEEKSRDIYHLN